MLICMIKKRSYTKADFDRNIEDLSRIAENTAEAFEVFNCCRTDSQFQKYALVFERFCGFFSPVTSMALSICVIHLYKFFDSRNEAVSLEKVIEEAKQTTMINDALATGLRDQLRKLQPLRKKVGILRHSVFAHRNDSQTIEQIFQSAGVASKDLEAGFLAAGEIINTIRQNSGLNPLNLQRRGDLVHTHTDNVLMILKQSEGRTDGKNGL